MSVSASRRCGGDFNEWILTLFYRLSTTRLPVVYRHISEASSAQRARLNGPGLTLWSCTIQPRSGDSRRGCCRRFVAFALHPFFCGLTPAAMCCRRSATRRLDDSATWPPPGLDGRVHACRPSGCDRQSRCARRGSTGLAATPTDRFGVENSGRWCVRERRPESHRQAVPQRRARERPPASKWPHRNGRIDHAAITQRSTITMHGIPK
jgi:hypothetical protein